MAVLSLLAEAPMHPYRMQQLIRQRGKDKVVNVGQRASLYKVIDRLARAGLVAVRETSRDQNFPERTVYELTDLGREVLLDWLRDALAAPAAEFPEFPAALSFLAILTPGDVLAHLERREVHLVAEVAGLEGGLRALAIPRLFLVEDEYRLAVLRAELEWVTSVIDDLRSGELTWTEEWAREQASTDPG
jgi:DNA-binding PadR family transcriptional regulator